MRNAPKYSYQFAPCRQEVGSTLKQKRSTVPGNSMNTAIFCETLQTTLKSCHVNCCLQCS